MSPETVTDRHSPPYAPLPLISNSVGFAPSGPQFWRVSKYQRSRCHRVPDEGEVELPLPLSCLPVSFATPPVGGLPQRCHQEDSRSLSGKLGTTEKGCCLQGVPGEGEGLGLAVPPTSFSIFTKPSTRVLLPSCRKVRSRGWREKQVRKRRFKGPFPFPGSHSILGGSSPLGTQLGGD